MINELYVLIGETLAGKIARGRGGLRFSYEESYRARREPTPISVSMPVESAEHTDPAVAPWLWGLLPDNERVLARWAQRFQVSHSAFALLGTPVGEDCAGAVRFVTEDRLEAALNRKGEVHWLDEAGVASRLRDLEGDPTSWLGSDFNGRFSLAGAQAKTALLCQGGQWGVPSGSAATSHILKPAIRGLGDHELNEHLCLRAAQNAGLVSVQTEILAFEDQRVVVARRYDRVDDVTGWLRRVHQEDLCQATGRSPQLKYQNEGGPTPVELVRLLRRVLNGPDADIAVWRFFDAMTLNWLICGTDAHSKNYSLLLSGQQVRLAPLYDVASALPYGLPAQKLRMAMKFGGTYLLTGSAHTIWRKVAKELGLPYQPVVDRAASLMQRLPDAFADAARDPSVRATESTLPHRLVDRVADRVATLRSTLSTSNTREE